MKFTAAERQRLGTIRDEGAKASALARRLLEDEGLTPDVAEGGLLAASRAADAIGSGGLIPLLDRAREEQRKAVAKALAAPAPKPAVKAPSEKKGG